MKRLAYILLSTAAVSLFAGCTKELNDEPVVIPGETIELTVNAGFTAYESTDTRTVVDGSAIKWSSASEEKIKVYEVATDGGSVSVSQVTSGAGTSSDSYVTMSFPVSLTSKTADNFTYYATYPFSAHVSNSSTLPQANLETSSAQTPSATSFDPSADLLISKGIDNGTTQPTSVNMQFARPVAIAKMTITNLPVAETVNKVVFSANNGSAVTLAGRTNFNLTTAQPVTSYGDAIAKTEIEIGTSGLGLSASTSMDVWFTCYPFELSTGNTFTVVVETDTYSCSRTVTIPAARELNFVSGKASRFSVDMTTATVTKAQLWSKYTGDFSAGEYLIVYAGQAMKADVSGGRLTYTGVIETNDEVYTNNASIIWEAAASSTYWTLYNAGVNKYAASTGAKNAAQLLDNGSDDKSLWTVSGSSTYEFVNKKNTENSVNANLRYNSGSGFACYGTGTGGALTLYKKDTRTQLSAPATVSASLNGSDNTVIDVTFASVANAGTYTIVATPSVGDAVVKAGVSSSPATISVADGLAYATTYTVSVYAVPADASLYRKSGATAAAGTVTTGPRPAPSTGTMIWSEDFTGWTEWQTSASGASHVYGGGTVNYSKDASTSFYLTGTVAGGVAPEVMVGKNGGYFTVSNVPVSGATSATLFYTTNNQYINVTTSPSSTVTVKNYENVGPRIRAIEITEIPAATELLTITLTNGNDDSNSRIDDLILKAGTKTFQSLSFADAAVNWVIGTDCTLDTEETAPQLVTGANTSVYYSSSDPTIASVNSSTGAITVRKKGSVSITATAAENASYWSSTASYTLNITEDGVVLEWSRPASSDVLTSGFTGLYASEGKTGYRQDGSGTVRYVGAYHKTNKLFASTPTSVTVKATIGGGDTKDPLGNNVCVCFVDNSGSDIDGSEVVVTTKVEATTGKEYSVSMSTVKAVDAYGIKIYHTKETGYNVRYYSFSVEYE